jgi:hypothetical protein
VAFRNVPATAAPEPTANEVDFVAANESSS